MAHFNKLQHFCVCEGLYCVCARVWVNVSGKSEAFLGCLPQFLSALNFGTYSLAEPGTPRSSYTGWPESSGGLLSPSPQCWDYRHWLPHPLVCGCWETELQSWFYQLKHLLGPQFQHFFWKYEMFFQDSSLQGLLWTQDLIGDRQAPLASCLGPNLIPLNFEFLVLKMCIILKSHLFAQGPILHEIAFVM